MTLLQTEFVATKSYPFQNLRYLLQQLGIRQGVVGSNDYVASQRAAGANMSVDISAGGAFIKGIDTARQGLYHQVNDAAVNVVVPASNATNPRLDQVVLQANDSTVPTGSGDIGTLVTVQGTATSGATLDNRTGAATLPNSCMPVCDVLVPAAASSIVNANIRDRRPPSSFLGINIPTVETISDTTYRRMPTADQVANVELPTNAYILVGFQAIWQANVSTNGRAAIFVGANQLKQASTLGAPTVQEARTQNTINVDDVLATGAAGLMFPAGGTSSAVTEVTTGQVVGIGDGTTGGLCCIFAAAGTYDVSIQFKNSAAGNLTVKNRHLLVGVLGAQ